MAPITEKEIKCVPEYPTEGKHAAALEKAHARFLQELSSTEGWKDKGEKNGVKLSSKPNPDNPSDVNIVKGVCTVTNATTDDLFAAIYLPGFRKLWDPRYAGAYIIERFARDVYSFYSLVKGVGMVVDPRDFVCINKNYISSTLGQDITVVHCSVEEPQLAPEQSGRVRAHMTFGGWYLKAVGNDVELTYIIHVSLKGSLPVTLVKMVSLDTPLCVGTARDAFKKYGFPPQTRIAADSPTIIQNETFSEDGSKPKEYTCFFQPKKGGSFSIIYDTKTMYPSGVTVSGGEGTTVADDGKGVISVTCEEDGELTTIYVKSK